MTDFWGALLALLVINAPLWLAWVLLDRSDRRRGRPSEPGAQRD